MARRKHQAKAEIKTQYIIGAAIAAAVVVIAVVVIYGGTSTAKFSFAATSQTLSGTTASYSGGILTFTVTNELDKELQTSKLGLRIPLKRGCMSEITTNPKAPIENAPKCVNGCGTPFASGGRKQIQINLAGSKCDLAGIPAGSAATAYLYFS